MSETADKNVLEKDLKHQQDQQASGVRHNFSDIIEYRFNLFGTLCISALRHISDSIGAIIQNLTK